MVLNFCTSSEDAYICTKFGENINTFKGVRVIELT